MQDVTSAFAEADLSQGLGELQEEEKFVPKGAVAFFGIMLLVYAAMWFSIYFELIGRH